MTNTHKLLLIVALNTATTVITVGALFFGWQAMADQNAATDNVPRLIPYHGTLEFNGQPVTATGDEAPWMQFEVYDGNGANAPLLYTQQLQVEVYNGQFTTALGPTGENNTSLEGVVAYADDLYLKLTLLNDPDDDTDDIALANSQRLLVAPFALWATKSADFDVANDLEVARDVGIGRNLNVIGNAAITGNAAVTGNTTLTGTLTANGNISDANSDVTIADGLIVTGNISDSDSDVTINDGLIVSGNISDSNGDVTIADWLTVTGNTTLTGTLTVTGNISDSNSDVTVNDGLIVTGAIAPSAGSATTNGINFPDNPAGTGGGDDAWIRYYPDGSGEDYALQIGIDNDADDDLEFYQDGAIRMEIGNNIQIKSNMYIDSGYSPPASPSS